MTNIATITYDQVADVLYVTYHDEPAAAAKETRGGTVYRLSGDGRLVGVTIMDFAERLRKSHGEITLATLHLPYLTP